MSSGSPCSSLPAPGFVNTPAAGRRSAAGDGRSAPWATWSARSCSSGSRSACCSAAGSAGAPCCRGPWPPPSGCSGLRVFSQLVFSPLIASNAVTYGPFGTVLVIQSWLVGVGFVVYGGALVGRLFHEERVRRRLDAAGELAGPASPTVAGTSPRTVRTVAHHCRPRASSRTLRGGQMQHLEDVTDRLGRVLGPEGEVQQLPVPRDRWPTAAATTPSARASRRARPAPAPRPRPAGRPRRYRVPDGASRCRGTAPAAGPSSYASPVQCWTTGRPKSLTMPWNPGPQRKRFMPSGAVHR